MHKLNFHIITVDIIFQATDETTEMRKTETKIVKRKRADLLNQSPELYESRSRDFERRISSPAWKNGIP